MQRKLPDCHLKHGAFRGFTSCPQAAHYRATLSLSNGREINMELCSEHMRNAARIAEIEAARAFPGADVKVTSIRFHHLALRGDRAHAS
ncbi:MAG TPA: hypothetical protein VM912_11600 [Terriglobales bacterium]|nr:hypothetical protein [Terriglobales bacterium]